MEGKQEEVNIAEQVAEVVDNAACRWAALGKTGDAVISQTVSPMTLLLDQELQEALLTSATGIAMFAAMLYGRKYPMSLELAIMDMKMSDELAGTIADAFKEILDRIIVVHNEVGCSRELHA